MRHKLVQMKKMAGEGVVLCVVNSRWKGPRLQPDLVSFHKILSRCAHAWNSNPCYNKISFLPNHVTEKVIGFIIFIN